MVKSVVKHIFDRFFSFSEPPEIRTVEGFSAVFAFVRCEHRLCSQSRRATSCATPRKNIVIVSYRLIRKRKEKQIDKRQADIYAASHDRYMLQRCREQCRRYVSKPKRYTPHMRCVTVTNKKFMRSLRNNGSFRIVNADNEA